MHTIHYTHYLSYTQKYGFAKTNIVSNIQNAVKMKRIELLLSLLPSGYCDWSRIAMSLTLHATEIWLNTGTDSGGMKDRTHGIFLRRASEMQDTDKHNTALFTSNLRFTLWFGFLTVGPKVMHHDKCLHGRSTFSVELQDGGWPWHLVQSRRLGLCVLRGSPRGWGGGGWGGGSECSRNWMLASPFSWV